MALGGEFLDPAGVGGGLGFGGREGSVAARQLVFELGDPAPEGLLRARTGRERGVELGEALLQHLSGSGLVRALRLEGPQLVGEAFRGGPGRAEQALRFSEAGGEGVARILQFHDPDLGEDELPAQGSRGVGSGFR